MIFPKSFTPLLLVLSLMITGVQIGPGPLPSVVQPTFIHGGQIDSQGPNIDLAVNLAIGMEMGWVSTGLDWSANWPEQSQGPQLSNLIHFLELAEQKNLKVMVTLHNPPEWALQSTGPDPDFTAELVSTLYTASPPSLKAIELFPGINTVSGWGRNPDPQAFLELYKIVEAVLNDLHSEVILIPGLQPLAGSTPGDLDDLDYLQKLYAAGNDQPFSTIGVHFSVLAGQPMDEPQTSRAVTLRHYELVRKVMLQNGHSGGQIWITGFSWSHSITDGRLQAYWVSEAFKLMKAQLFLGAAFFESISPAEKSARESTTHSLLLPSLSLHPACKLIAEQFATHVYLVTP